MASGKKSALLSSLADYGDDSEPDYSDPEPEETEEEHGGTGGLVFSYDEDDLNRTEGVVDKESENEDSRESNLEMTNDESDEARDADDVEVSEVEAKDPNELVALFSEKVRNMSPDEIRIPPEPPGRCSSQLQEKIHKLYERKLHGDFDTNSHIQKKKEFRNPSIYEKLIQFCSIDELGTNYPKDMFDPHGWSEDSYYEALAKAQKVEMDKLEKAKKERTKVRLKNRVCHRYEKGHQPIQHISFNHKQQQHNQHSHRFSQEEEQVGLCHPSDPGPAHAHQHHHGHPALRRVCDDDSQRHQDHRHLCGGHHRKESQTVKPVPVQMIESYWCSIMALVPKRPFEDI
ncbi:SAP30-binding protein [Phycodurus eques]|uniref:SAP30-binding protein n=1 Tax=Phycodurus eques TaxID=693459 RepID=UPI002ACD608C|nr:SAP30-binding protein [Phycodurus eques]